MFIKRERRGRERHEYSLPTHLSHSLTPFYGSLFWSFPLCPACSQHCFSPFLLWSYVTKAHHYISRASFVCFRRPCRILQTSIAATDINLSLHLREEDSCIFIGVLFTALLQVIAVLGGLPFMFGRFVLVKNLFRLASCHIWALDMPLLGLSGLFQERRAGILAWYLIIYLLSVFCVINPKYENSTQLLFFLQIAGGHQVHIFGKLKSISWSPLLFWLIKFPYCACFSRCSQKNSWASCLML